MEDDSLIGPEEDKVIINIFRKGKDIFKNEKIKEIIERFHFKIKKEIKTTCFIRSFILKVVYVLIIRFSCVSVYYVNVF